MDILSTDAPAHKQPIHDSHSARELWTPNIDEFKLVNILLQHPTLSRKLHRQVKPLLRLEIQDEICGCIFGAAMVLSARYPDGITPISWRAALQATLEECVDDPNTPDPQIPYTALKVLSDFDGASVTDNAQATKEVLALAKSIKKRYQASMPPLSKGIPQSTPIANKHIEFSTDEDLDTCLSNIQWLWENYIPRGFVTALVGDQEQGKSMVAQSLCDIILRGKQWPDEKQHIPQPDAHLLWVETEGAISVLHSRMCAWNMPRGRFILPKDPLQELRIDDADAWHWIENVIKEFHPPLVVIDSLSGAHQGKENSNDDMKLILKRLSELAQRYQIAVLVIHHLNKIIMGMSDYPITLARIRGASAITQFCRSVLALGVPDKARPENRRLDVIKLNLARKPAPVGYVLTDHGPSWGRAPEAIVARHAIDDAMEFLRVALAHGARESDEVKAEAKQEGIGNNALQNAKKALNVKSKREMGKNGRWFMSLPTADTADDLPEHGTFQ